MIRGWAAELSSRMRDASAWCLEHRRITYGASALLLLLAGASAANLRIDPSPEAYLYDRPEWALYAAIDDEYEIGETIVIALREVGGTVFDVETLGALAELDRALRQHAGVSQVLSLVSAPVSEADDDTVALRWNHANLAINRERAFELGEQIRQHPLYQQVLVDERHETTFIFVQLSPFEEDPVARLEAVRHVSAEADRFRSKQRTIHLAGSPVVKEAVAAGVQHDTLLFFPAALALLAVLLWLIFGNAITALIPLGVVGYASIIVAGLLAILKVPLNMATATVPTMILVVGLADSVHLLAELQRQFARTGDRRASLLATVEHIALPCLLTSITSAVGFFALAFSRVAPLRQFGWSTALGLMLAYFTSLLLGPVLLDQFGFPSRRVRPFPTAPVMARILGKLAERLERHLLATLAVTGLLFGGCYAAMSGLAVDSDFVAYLDPEHRLRRDIATIERTLGGADVIEVLVTAPNPDYFSTHQGLTHLDQLSDRLRKIDGVARAVGLPEFVRLANAAILGRPGSLTDPLPDSAQIAQLLESSPITTPLLNGTRSQARIALQVRPLSTEEVLRLVQAGRAAVATELEGTGLVADFTGLPPLFAQVVHHLVEDASQSFGLATVLIFVCMIIGLGSFRLAMVAMVPNLLPVGLTFATMALLGFDFDTNSAFVACLGLGVAVDDTIHITARYARAIDEGAPDPASALRYALTQAGWPVILTSVLLAVGFSVLCLSSFRPTFRVGFLSLVLVLYAVLLDLVLLPVLLLASERAKAAMQSEALRFWK